METKRHLHAGKRDIEIYPAQTPGAPILYLNTFGDESGNVLRALGEVGAPDFTLAAIAVPDWNGDLSPWAAPAISPAAVPSTGGADAYLALLTDEIVPAVEALLPAPPCRRGLAGYSLAGLFALYALYRTDAFSHIASVSGSLWFPGFADFAVSQPMAVRPRRLYLSLGDREHRTGNVMLRSVLENTERLAAFYAQAGIDTVFELNPGNHNKAATRRTANALRRLLEEPPREQVAQ